MEVFAMNMTLREQGAAMVKAAIDKLRTSFQGLGKDAKAVDAAMGGIGSWIAGGVGISGVVAGLSKVVTETSNAQFAQAQLAAALQSTRYVSGQTTESLNKQAEALARLTIFEDDAITGAQSLLLTFTQIKGDVFPKATEAVLNVAQGMGTDLKSAAIQVGKALNDPIMGVTALARAGIQFTASQKEMIKELVESNRLLDAQKIILGELETQFGGSATAARDTFGGALRGLQNDIGNLFEISQEKSGWLVDALNNMARFVRGLDSILNGEFFKTFKVAVGLMPYATEKMDNAGKSFASFLNTTKGKATGLEQTAGALGMFTSEALRVYPATIAAATGIATVGDAADETAKKIDRLKKPVMAPWTRVVDEVAPINPKELFGLNTSMWEQPIDAFAERAHQKLREISLGLRNTVLLEFGALFGDAFATAIETAISQKSIGAGFKALAGTLLAGLGDMMVRFGAAALQAAILTNAFFKSLANNPATAIPAALAIIAVGASLKAAAAGIFSGMNKGASGSVSGGGGYGSGSGGSITLPRVSFGATTAGAASGLSPVAPVNVTIIGPNDPVAQRAMQELMTKANRRGAV